MNKLASLLGGVATGYRITPLRGFNGLFKLLLELLKKIALLPTSESSATFNP
jgi:hypothetical protein